MTHSNPQTLLSTVSLIIFDANGKRHSVRALLDSGSQINLITKSLASRLQLPINSSLHNLSVLQGQSMTCNKSVKIKIKSKLTSFEHKLYCVIIDNITQHLPSSSIDYSHWRIPDHVQLADPDFNIPGPIDLLMGAELYFGILQQGCIRLGKNLPILKNSRFGWLLSGVYSGDAGSESYVGFVSNEDLHEELARFWQTRTRFLNLERRLVKNKDLNLAYSNFINEYVKLSHAELTSLTGEDFDNKYYFLLHHPVFKDGNVNKIRVVFDASCKTSTGLSLNNVMHTGPKLQQDLFSILIRFRCHLYVFVADIVKMYRQIKVRDADANLQLIIWRDSPQKRLDIYKLNTVTYGTSCAPYLAMRCLKMLSEENSVKYPLASQTLDRDCYVDDIITGASSEQELGQLKLEVCSLLKLGCFQLHKWSSNSRSLLGDVPKEQQNLSATDFSEQNNTVKTLGLSWNPVEDIFKISYSNVFITSTDTKRSKDALPDELQDSWNDFRHHLSCLEGLSVPRCLFKQVPVSIQCHGFADASLLAYGACVYLRATYEDGSISCHLICSKSKVAPLKQVTLPRLELLAALLLAKLYRHVMAKELTPAVMWKHVSSKDNPADIVSRGVRIASDLLSCDLGFVAPEKIGRIGFVIHQKISCRKHGVSKFSKLVRIVAYCLRWRKKRGTVPLGDPLSAFEIQFATLRIFYLVQLETFSITNDEDLETDKVSIHKLKSLNPFRDADGVLRVGGRLEHAKISFNQKHPIILPKKHVIVRMFLKSEHERLLHAGTQTVLGNVRLNYWPINGRNALKQIIHNCCKCARFKAAAAS
ncbi:uncharacterized protein LOC113384765 [Ctenocephalides felis]|uniref:uncharacterized protein LOC113384765 n=1 Tax=Ctenocephalides felis TaxID=7515 RepID=UPI000E6E5028|nr:uncharacterized protein LOC113384765 [Ctenocephalides felis]